jgi:threonine/homoserine/homoserine lactone efflux protein
MQALVNFSLAFFFSFTGSLTPGTVNLSCVQLGLEHKARLAWRFALAAAMVEYGYAFLAVTFEKLITSSPLIIRNFHLLAAIVMLTLGILTIRSVSAPSNLTLRFQNSGFRRGLVLGILNPLAMPFWIGIVAYLKSVHWINLSAVVNLHGFLLGYLRVCSPCWCWLLTWPIKHCVSSNKIPGSKKYPVTLCWYWVLMHYFATLYCFIIRPDKITLAHGTKAL